MEESSLKYGTLDILFFWDGMRFLPDLDSVDVSFGRIIDDIYNFFLFDTSKDPFGGYCSWILWMIETEINHMASIAVDSCNS